MSTIREPSSGDPPRRRRRAARGTVVLTALLIMVAGGAVAASPASASTIRCVKVPAGFGGLDTLEVCTEISLKYITSTVELFTNCCRTPPDHVWLTNNLYMNDQGSGDLVDDCGRIPPGALCSFTRIRCNPVGTQKWWTQGGVREDYGDNIKVDTARTPNQWESVGGC